MADSEKENDLLAGEEGLPSLSEWYSKYGLDERGQRCFGRHVTVWRNAAVLETKISKRTLWRDRQVSNDQGWLIFMCGAEYEAVPPLSIPESKQLQSDLAEAIAFCEQHP